MEVLLSSKEYSKIKLEVIGNNLTRQYCPKLTLDLKDVKDLNIISNQTLYYTISNIKCEYLIFIKLIEAMNEGVEDEILIENETKENFFKLQFNILAEKNSPEILKIKLNAIKNLQKLNQKIYRKLLENNCTTISENCKECDENITKCTSCKTTESYGEKCALCKTKAGWKNCQTCLFDGSECLSCFEGSYGKNCSSSCSIGCKGSICNFEDGNCTNPGCEDDLYFGPKCDKKCALNIEWANCETCDQNSTTGKCKSCLNQKYFGDKCQTECSEGCKGGTCFINGTCTDTMECESGYYGEKCDKKCNEIEGHENCQSCSKDGTKCTACINNEFWGNSCQHKCGQGCIGGTCNFSTGKCLKAGCLENKFFTDNCDKSCTEIDSNCETCLQDGTKCLSCNENKYYGDKCKEKCGEGCISGTCNFSTGKCLKEGCIGNKFYTDKCDKSCTEIDSNCETCLQDGTKCLSCNENKYFGDKCKEKCSPHCQNDTCTIEGQCTIPGCVDSQYYLENCTLPCSNINSNCITCKQDGSICLSCKDDKYYGNTCEHKCSEGCINNICQIDGFCMEPGCKEDLYFDDYCSQKCNSKELWKNCISCTQSGEKCKSCLENKFYGNNCETPCSSSCTNGTCSIDGNCSCATQEYWGPDCNQTCTEISENCLYCVQDGKNCIKCKRGYYDSNCTSPCSNGCSENTCEIDGTCTCKEYKYIGDKCQKLCTENSVKDWTKCVTCDQDENGNCRSCKENKYYGNNCENICSEGCNENLCDFFGNCTREGCKNNEYFGTKCDTKCNSKKGWSNCEQCDKEGTKCTTCKGNLFYGENCNTPCSVGCIDGLCDINGKCLSEGCRDDKYFGPNCDQPCTSKDIWANCETCSKSGDKCLSCKESKYYGTNCETECAAGCTNSTCDIEGKCYCTESKYYGEKCDKKCTEKSPHCEKCNQVGNNECIQCIDNFYYGTNCENKCADGCKEGTCDINGNCKKGCKDSKYVGDDCSKTCKEYSKKDWKNCETCDQFGEKCYSCINKEHWGVNCQKECGPGCANKQCNIDDGTCKCTGDKYYGEQCDKPCSNLGSNCLTCSSEGKCLSCKNDKYYGDKCENSCSEGCIEGKCEHEAGHCYDKGCKGDQYYGEKCKDKCSSKWKNCDTCDKYGTECKTCKDNKYYGEDCSINCGEGCISNICNKATGVCLNTSGCKDNKYLYDTCNVTCSYKYPNCTTCNNTEEICFSCQDNLFYGEKCEKKCSEGCKSKVVDEPGKCTIDGICIEGCNSTYYGKTCESKCDGCGESGCDNNGYCFQFKCHKNRFGLKCNQNCTCTSNSNSEECGKFAGECLDCAFGYYGKECESICDYRCKTSNCCVFKNLTKEAKEVRIHTNYKFLNISLEDKELRLLIDYSNGYPISLFNIKTKFINCKNETIQKLGKKEFKESPDYVTQNQNFEYFQIKGNLTHDQDVKITTYNSKEEKKEDNVYSLYVLFADEVECINEYLDKEIDGVIGLGFFNSLSASFFTSGKISSNLVSYQLIKNSNKEQGDDIELLFGKLNDEEKKYVNKLSSCKIVFKELNGTQNKDTICEVEGIKSEKYIQGIKLNNTNITFSLSKNSEIILKGKENVKSFLEQKYFNSKKLENITQIIKKNNYMDSESDTISEITYYYPTKSINSLVNLGFVFNNYSYSYSPTLFFKENSIPCKDKNNDGENCSEFLIKFNNDNSSHSIITLGKDFLENTQFTINNEEGNIYFYTREASYFTGELNDEIIENGTFNINLSPQKIAGCALSVVIGIYLISFGIYYCMKIKKLNKPYRYKVD